MSKLKTDAIEVVKAINAFQDGEDIQDAFFDERVHERQVKWVMQVMSRSIARGFPIPQDEIVAFFKTNLRRTEDEENNYVPFEECARTLDELLMEVKS